MSSSTDRARAAIEAHEIHAAACRYRRQELRCSTCSDLAERAIRAARLLVTLAPSDQLVIADGVVSWTRLAA